MARKKADECEPNMTPMIDVVFQLIIFFVLTLTMTDQKNEDIKLEMGPHGPEMTTVEQDPRMSLSLVIEVDKKGETYLAGRKISLKDIRSIVQRRYNKYGEFPVMIRGDLRTKHKDVRRVLDTVTDCGIGRVSFVALKKEGSDTKSKE